MRCYELYGVSDSHRVIDDLLALCPCESDHFPTALVMAEALTNAFVHGNRGDITKPILLTACVSTSYLKIRVEDCGQGATGQELLTKTEPDPWREGGRGLFLMKHYADDVVFERNTVVIGRKLCVAVEED